MKKMSKMKIFFFLLSVGLLFSSCYKEEDWVADNSTTEDKYFPVIQKVTVSTDMVATGDTSFVKVYFWSHDDIKNVELWENDALYTSWDFVDSFDTLAYAQVKSFDYVAPAVADTTAFTLKVIVNNVNGLDRTKSVDVTVVP